MKYIKLYESFEDIDYFCKKYSIENYTINSDSSIDVDGSVNLSYKKLTELPLKFGKVSGYFSCSGNQLTLLEGSPKSVDSFDCQNNKLTTLEGCPQSVGGFFACNNNQLTTLEGCPQSVGDHFNCQNNKLTILKGGPQSVGSYFNCMNNKLTTLEGSPQSVRGYFNFQENKLKDLYGFPEFFDGEVHYYNNPVDEILDLFKRNGFNSLTYWGKFIDLLNEYGVIQQDGKLVVLDRLEEVFHTLNMEIPEEINLKNYEVY